MESCKVYYQSNLAKYSMNEGEQLNRFFNWHGEQSKPKKGSEEPYLEKSQEINRFFNCHEEQSKLNHSNCRRLWRNSEMQCKEINNQDSQ